MCCNDLTQCILKRDLESRHNYGIRHQECIAKFAVAFSLKRWVILLMRPVLSLSSSMSFLVLTSVSSIPHRLLLTTIGSCERRCVITIDDDGNFCVVLCCVANQSCCWPISMHQFSSVIHHPSSDTSVIGWTGRTIDASAGGTGLSETGRQLHPLQIS